MNLRLLAIFGVIALFLVANPLLSQNATAQLEGTVEGNLIFDTKLAWIDASPSGSCTAIFSGYFNYTCSYLMIVHFNVKLEGEDTYEWSVAISPSRIIALAGTHQLPVHVHVHIPPATKESAAGKITVIVDVMPLGRLEPEFTVKDELMVRVKPFYKLAIACARPYSELSPGKEHYFNIQIANLGNGKDIFAVEITNQKEFEELGWFIDKSSTSIQLASGATGNILIKAVPLREWTLWKDNIMRLDLKVASLVSQEVVYDTLSVFIRQRGTYIPGFEPIFAIIGLGLVAVVLKKVKKR
ncbi:MAG: choice-of-anchor T family protein [Candidatus Thermoplasmatota archaeon]